MGFWGATSVCCLLWLFLVDLSVQLQGSLQPPPAHLAVGLSHLLRHSSAGAQGPLQSHGDSCPGAPYPLPLPNLEGREAEQRQPHGPGSCPWSQVSPASCKQVRRPLEFGGAGREPEVGRAGLAQRQRRGGRCEAQRRRGAGGGSSGRPEVTRRKYLKLSREHLRQGLRALRACTELENAGAPSCPALNGGSRRQTSGV